MPAQSIFVEIPIRTSPEALWAKTQEPAQHVRWDLRFTSIDYLPRPDPAAPQRFHYETRLGFGLRIAGWGESRSSRAEGTSDLVFGSDDPTSLIRRGVAAGSPDRRARTCFSARSTSMTCGTAGQAGWSIS